MHIIEEMILFPEPQPVQHIELDPQRVNRNSVILILVYNDYCRTGLCQFIFNASSCLLVSYSNSFSSNKNEEELDLPEHKRATDIFFPQWPFH